MRAAVKFRPLLPLVKGSARSACRAVVVIPVRNEEATLSEALDGLAAQVDFSGMPLGGEYFEILLLLNNCTDGSAVVAKGWAAAHPDIQLHIAERTLNGQDDNIGMARRLLMDTGWRRLRPDGSARNGGSATPPILAILSTDSDTVVASDWIARNLRALEGGTDVVGGVIRWKAGHLESLPMGARRAYERDRQYQRLVAELEDLIDPQDRDPWPRHLQHFGASLACTPQIYARAGGIPRVKMLEDCAFADALRRVDARLRHDPTVVVYTSSRLDGRAKAGLSKQLRIWQEMSEVDEEHNVPSAAWLMHRFRMLRRLRELWGLEELSALEDWPTQWRVRLIKAHAGACIGKASVGMFLDQLNCDRLIDETFLGVRDGEIVRVNHNLAGCLRKLRARQGSPLKPRERLPNGTNESGISGVDRLIGISQLSFQMQ